MVSLLGIVSYYFCSFFALASSYPVDMLYKFLIKVIKLMTRQCGVFQLFEQVRNRDFFCLFNSINGPSKG